MPARAVLNEAMNTVCPHCGEQIGAEDTLEIGPWRIWREGAELRGERIRLTAAEAKVLYTIASAKGRVVPTEVIGSQFTKSTNYHNSLRVIVARLRKKARGEVLIDTVQGVGYRWAEYSRPPVALVPRRRAS